VDATPDPEVTASLLRSRLVDGSITMPVAGSSMRGVIASGSTVHLVAAETPRPGEVWAFADDLGRILVHRVRHVDAETITGRGSGNDFDDEPVPWSRLIGRVVAAEGGRRVRRFGRVDQVRAQLLFAMRSAGRRLRDVVNRG
jgi:hypothetical protein